MYKLAVLGNPIAHSLSPQIHQAFAQQFQLPLSYERITTTADNFHQTIEHLRSNHYIGVNVTLPLKTLAFQYATTQTPEAELAQAANTLLFSKDEVIAHNTDGLGLIHDLKNNHHINLHKQDILICGAGGAARGILPLITEYNPNKVYLYNRTNQRLHRLIEDLKLSNCEQLHKITFNTKISPSLLINCIAQDGFYMQFKSTSLNLVQTFCYDLNYGHFHNSFVDVMKIQGNKNYCNGLGMLVAQAAKAFEFWFEQIPETQSVLRLISAIDKLPPS
ncbi:MAG: shikimate dehydrogenase [Legionellales bacterium]|nr:shikimate dehydrogenase [Legionellales bacterium]